MAGLPGHLSCLGEGTIDSQVDASCAPDLVTFEAGAEVGEVGKRLRRGKPGLANMKGGEKIFCSWQDYVSYIFLYKLFCITQRTSLFRIYFL